MMVRTALVMVALMVPAATALAQPTPVPAPTPAQAEATARAHAARAKAHFDRGEYAEAIVAYREAYRLLPAPGVLYNLAQAYRLVGDCGNAAVMYRDYLRLAPDSPHRRVAEENLVAAETCAAELTPRERAGTAPDEGAAAAAAAGSPPAGAAGPPSPSHRRHRTATIAAAAGGVVLAAAGTYFALDASKAAQEVSDFYIDGGPWADIADADARGRRSRGVAIVAFAGSGAALAAAATLYVLGRPRGERAGVAITAGRGGGEVVATWRF